MVDVTGRDFLGRLGAEYPGGEFRERGWGVSKFDRWKKLAEALLHRHRTWIAALGGALPLRKLVSDLLISLILQQPREKQISGLQQFEVLKVIDLAARQ